MSLAEHGGTCLQYPTHDAEAEGLRVQGQPTLHECGVSRSLESDLDPNQS